MTSEMIMEEVTVKALNQLSAAQNFLVLLRTLSTSDLSFTYMLLDGSSVRDIVKASLQIYRDDWESLTIEQRAEYITLCKEMTHNPCKG